MPIGIARRRRRMARFSRGLAIVAGSTILISGVAWIAMPGGIGGGLQPVPQTGGGTDRPSVAVVVDGAVRHQTLEGFGQAEPSVLAYPGPESLSDTQRAVGIDKAYKQVGINTGIIGSLLESPSDYKHAQNDNDDPFTINWRGFNADALKSAKKYVVDLARPYGFTKYYLGAEAPNIRWASPWLADIRRRDYNSYLDEVAEQVLANVTFWKDTYGEELPYYQLGNEQLSG